MTDKSRSSQNCTCLWTVEPKHMNLKKIRGIEIAGGQLYAVVSSLKEERPVERGVSQLFLHGTMYKESGEIMYYIIPVETMNETALIVQNVSENLEIIGDVVL